MKKIQVSFFIFFIFLTFCENQKDYEYFFSKTYRNCHSRKFLAVLSEARNQEFFRSGEFSWNQGTSTNNHLQNEKERSRRTKISSFFSWKLLKKFTINEKFNAQMTAIRAFFPKFGYFFLISRKEQRRTLRQTFFRNFCVTACSFSKTIFF